MTTGDSRLSPAPPPRLLTWLVRLQGLALLSASGPIVMPSAWMQAIHSTLSLGELPAMPIVEYLTRSVSALYAVHGLITVYISFDLNRYRPLLGLLIALNAGLGIIMLGIDLWAQMPWWWTLLEGPPIAAFALFLAGLYLRWIRAEQD